MDFVVDLARDPRTLINERNSGEFRYNSERLYCSTISTSCNDALALAQMFGEDLAY